LKGPSTFWPHCNLRASIMWHVPTQAVTRTGATSFFVYGKGSTAFEAARHGYGITTTKLAR
jgi:hypothetical protein